MYLENRNIRRGFVFSGLMLVILTVVIVSGNYLFLSSKAYESGVGRVMIIDAVLNVHEDVKSVVGLGSKNILLDAVEEAAAGGGACTMTSSELETAIEDRIDGAFSSFNGLLSGHGITVTKGTLSVTASASGKKCKASASVELDFTVSTTDNSIKKTGHLEASESS